MKICYQIFLDAKRNNKRLLLPLVDPDKVSAEKASELGRKAQEIGIEIILVGGSLLIGAQLDETILALKKTFSGKIILFPGNAMQVSAQADGILFLSLISGRNPELLIGKHVIAAPYIKKAQLESIATGYMLIDGGKPTSASYMSASFPIPHNKHDIAACTAMAGEMLGLQCIYMDAGSGADNPISGEMIGQVKKQISIPLIIGGGIRNRKALDEAFEAGADAVVIGNILEKSPELLHEMFAD